jgi:uncharacterized protein YunC (DUF1805 family)
VLAGNLGHGDEETRLSATKVESLTAAHSVLSVACGAFHVAIIATEVISAAVVVGVGGVERIGLQREDSEVSIDMGAFSSYRTVLMTW